MLTPFLRKLGPKIAILRGFTIFFRTTGLQHKILKLIESPNIFHWKSAKEQRECGLRGKIRAKLGPML